jgi:GH25 family lysozyme M1 (1,4-beta-N-acetylmuramidase)
VYSPQRGRKLQTVGPILVACIAASLALGNVASASADSTTLSRAKRSASRASVAEGDATMGWRNESAASSLMSASAVAAPKGVNGMDVSRWQGTVNWSYWKAHGKTFVYVKATQGTYYQNAYFGAQYAGSKKVGMFRGAYHFATPNRSSGVAQANYFVAHGGAWTRDLKTLPGVLDIEYNPYGSTCYGLTKKQMVAWIKAFVVRYKVRTKRDAVIYTTLDWWTRCTGNSTAFRYTNPLWVARYSRSVGKLPGGWPFYTFWQYSSSPLDQDHFSANRTRLVALAKG